MTGATEAERRRVLVVVLSDLDADAVRKKLEAPPGEELEVRVVAPMWEISRLDRLTGDDTAERERAQERAGDAAEAARPVARAVGAGPGDADVLTAVEDELRTFEADEILVLVSPRDRERMADGDERTLERFGPPVSYSIIG